MKNEVAFLRAVNVGGRASVKMVDLVRVFESAGCRNVRTYIQSGNILFQSYDIQGQTLRLRVQKSLRTLLGQDVLVAYRTVRELQGVLAAAPFGGLETDPDVKLYVGFLIDKPDHAPVLPLSLPKEGLEIIRISKLDVFGVSRKVKGRFGFPNAWIEKEFAVPATTRNWTTVSKIVALATEPER